MAGIIGIENVYFATNASSALSTANVVGTVGLTADQASKSCVEIQSNTVEAVVGTEKGDKA